MVSGGETYGNSYTGYTDETNYYDSYGNFSGQRSITTIFTWDDEGNLLNVVKIIVDSNAAGETLQVTRETVEAISAGSPSTFGGKRITTTFNADGTRSTQTSNIIVGIDQTGDYQTNAPHPDRSNSNSSGNGSSEKPGDEPPKSPPNKTDPGPMTEDDMAEFCQRMADAEHYESGVEQAASNDPTAFAIGCNDVVGDPGMNDDECTIFAWAGPEDLSEVVASSGDGCDVFQQVGQGGDCEPTSGLVRMKGLIAMLASADLGRVQICDPIVCDPAGIIAPSDLQVEAQEPISDQGQVLSGTVSKPGLCYWGPGDKYPTVNSLKKETTVQIVGIGIIKGWLVIDSPVYPGFPCWTSEEGVLPDPGFDPGSLPVIDIPQVQLELPDEGGGKKGEGGGSQASEGPGDCGPDEYWSIALQSCQPFP